MPNIIFFTYFIMASLPKSFNLAEPIPSLPDGATSQLISCRPISGGTFTQQQIIEVDLGNRGFCDPKSLAIRYKVRINTDASGAAMIGVPVYTPFQRVSTLVGGASIDTVNQYNQVAQVLVNGQYSIADKYGNQSGFGFSNPDPSGATAGNMMYLDGRAFGASLGDAGAGANFYLSAPIIGTLLTNCEKQLPLFALPSIRLQFTLDSIANMSFIKLGAVGTGYAAFTKFEISNFEVVYTMTDMGAGVEKMVYDMGRQLSLKTHGISNSAVSVPSATSGSQAYVFNMRFASIRSAFLCPNRADGAGNKWGEIADMTNGSGDYQLLIGNNAFPQTPLSTTLNDSGILTETRRAFGSLYDAKNSMSINTAEFTASINDGSNNLLYYEPSKFIVGVNLNKVQNEDNVLMCGVSTYNTPITAIVNVNTATTVAANLNLILDYDAVLVLDTVARQLSVRS
jgi:hypothetical protein